MVVVLVVLVGLVAVVVVVVVVAAAAAVRVHVVATLHRVRDAAAPVAAAMQLQLRETACLLRMVPYVPTYQS